MDIRDQIIQSGLYEILPQVKSMFTKRNYMLLSFESIVHAEQKLNTKMQSLKAEKEEELFKLGHTTWGVKDRMRWNVNIEGFEVDIIDYVGKNLWDFLHYARMSLDMIPQILNVVAFDPESRKEREKLRLNNFIKDLPEEYSETIKALKKASENESYRYIQDADNYLKHVDSIPVKLRTTGFFEDFDTFVINSFFNRSTYHEEKIVSETLVKIRDDVNSIISDFFKSLFNSFGTTDRRNYITDIKYEIVMEEGTLLYLAFFIDIPTTSTDLTYAFGSNTIYVHPLIVDNNMHIFEDAKFGFDTVFIRAEDTNEIVGKARIKDRNTEAYYKAYEVEPCDRAEYADYVAGFKEKYKHLNSFNMVALQGVEKHIIKE